MRFSLKIFVVFTISIFITFAMQSSESFGKEKLEKKYTDAFSKFIDVDGNRVHYRDEGKGETVVLLHGTASSLHTWNQWSNELKEQYRVIRVDLPGFGLTGPDGLERYEVDDDVAFLTHFLNKLNIRQFHLVGSSLGGRIAWQFALTNQSRLASLTLIASLGYPQQSWPPGIALAQWPVVGEFLSSAAPKFLYEHSLKEVYFDHTLVNEQLVNRYYQLAHYPGNKTAFPKRVQARLDKDSHLIPKISTPTLIMWGKEDRYFPADNANKFNRDISNSTLIIYPNVGHLPMEEIPIQSVNDFTSFIKDVGLM